MNKNLREWDRLALVLTGVIVVGLTTREWLDPLGPGPSGAILGGAFFGLFLGWLIWVLGWFVIFIARWAVRRHHE